MIRGHVTPDQEATVRLDVRGPDGSEQTVEAVLDTGFDGWLSLPSLLVGALRLHWRQRGRAILADGNESVAEKLLESLDHEEFEVSPEWMEEIRRRCGEIDDGAVDLIPADQVFEELGREIG